MDIDEGARVEKVKALLRTSGNPAMHKLSTSAAVLNILTDSSPRIRTDGDKVAHEVCIGRSRYSNAIERCKSTADREALNLFLNLVVTYEWQ